MPYKVEYDTYTVMPDKSIGNVIQSRETVYINMDTDKIESSINKMLSLEKKQRICKILKMDLISGIIFERTLIAKFES